jgi:hypothetical protein
LLLILKKPSGFYIKPKIDLHTIWRICIDYRELNQRTTKNAHPLPYAMDQIQRAAGHMWYCFLDLKDGFWHIKIAEKDRHKTAFITPFGLYEWIRMPFGLCNASAIFQALVEEMIGEFDFAGGLLDDIAIWADTLEQLYEKVKIILDRLCEYGMRLNTKKSVIYVREGVFLGFVVSIKGISADTDKIAAIRERSEPSTTTKMRAFVNAAGYFQHLIHRYADKSAFFTLYTGGPKGQKIKLSPKAKKAWQQIRDLITTLPIFKLFD